MKYNLSIIFENIETKYLGEVIKLTEEAVYHSENDGVGYTQPKYKLELNQESK